MSDAMMEAPQRILPTGSSPIKAAEWTGKNRSGILPTCDRVLILVDEGAEITTGGVILTENVRDAQTSGATTGVLIATGPQAFAYDTGRITRWVGAKPQPGDRIFFTRYAGQEYIGRDGKKYRLISDQVIAGMEDPEFSEGEK